MGRVDREEAVRVDIFRDGDKYYIHESRMEADGESWEDEYSREGSYCTCKWDEAGPGGAGSVK